MNTSVRLEAKALLSGHTAKLFLISFFSFLSRYVVLAFFVFSIVLYYKSDLFSFFIKQYGNVITYSISTVVFSLLAFGLFLFISAIKSGERFAYLIRANGGSGSFRLLFKFMHPKNSLKCLVLYTKIHLLQAMWNIYFFLPTGICVLCIYYLKNIVFTIDFAFIILLAGAIITFSAAIVMSKTNKQRYSAAPHYLFLNKKLTPKEAIEKSLYFTDGFLLNGTVLDFSFTGWVLSCIFIIPVFYVVPFIKLAKTIYITEALLSPVMSKTEYPINILGLQSG